MKLLLFFLFNIPLSLWAQNEVCFNFEPNPNSSDPALALFTKYINVYGFGIYAESSIDDAKVLHAAAITAEYLDNNEDGEIDDPIMFNELLTREALMPILVSENSTAAQSLFNNYNGEGISAVLFEEEIRPEGSSSQQGFDATLEEILHTITAIGYANAYPQAFSEEPNSNSLLTQAMDAARGGHFLSIPNNYPEEAWYHYDDETCDYNCMATEYIYWGITTKLGLQNYPNRCQQIANEWEICTPEVFQNTDVLLSALLSNPIYHVPTIAPDGNYCPMVNQVITVKNNTLKLYPNPVINKLFLDFEQPIQENIAFNIVDINGKVVYHSTLTQTKNQIDLSQLLNGLYFLSLENNMAVYKFFKKKV